MEGNRKAFLPLSSTGKYFRRVLYGAIGVVLSSYVVLFILVLSRHIDRGAQQEVRRALTQEARRGPGLLGADRWATMARILVSDDARFLRVRRKIYMCTQPHFRRAPGPTTALASFPGSGNTWVRFLVQQATGLLTGSVYRDYSLKRNGFPAESVANGSVLLVKTHEWGEATRKRFQKAVLLMRDPYGALIAEFNRRAGGHVGHASPEKFHKGNAWQSFVFSHARLWMESILDWLQFTGPLLVLHYEGFTSNLPAELIRLLRFLEINVSWSAFECALKNRDGIFRRAKRPMDFDPFDEAMREAVNSYKKIVNRALKYRATATRNFSTPLTSVGLNISAITVTYLEGQRSDDPS